MVGVGEKGPEERRVEDKSDQEKSVSHSGVDDFREGKVHSLVLL